MKEYLTYDDVLLEPQYSEIESRSTIDLQACLGTYIPWLKIPIIAAPMDTVCEDDMAIALNRQGGLGIIHRYNSIDEQVELVQQVKDLGCAVGAAVGTVGNYLERVHALVQADVDVICIDVAHGHHKLVKEAIQNIKKAHPKLHVMAGNIASAKAFQDLEEWGANSIRVGVGGGSICSTRLQTGHGVPNLSVIMDCAAVAKETKIIADGGIRTSGDMVKALAAGADFVMVGSMLAGTKESPGEVHIDHKNGKKYKVYRGMASREAQTDWRGSSSAPEGISATVEYKGDLIPLLEDIIGGIKSGLSYSGAKNLNELRTKAVFVRQTMAGQKESWTHILSK